MFHSKIPIFLWIGRRSCSTYWLNGRHNKKKINISRFCETFQHKFSNETFQTLNALLTSDWTFWKTTVSHLGSAAHACWTRRNHCKSKTITKIQTCIINWFSNDSNRTVIIIDHNYSVREGMQRNAPLTMSTTYRWNFAAVYSHERVKRKPFEFRAFLVLLLAAMSSGSTVTNGECYEKNSKTEIFTTRDCETRSYFTGFPTICYTDDIICTYIILSTIR